MYGGFAGGSWIKVEAFDNGNVIYSGYGANGPESYIGNVGLEKISNIYNTFLRNDFLALNERYNSYIVYDDFYISITMYTDADSHKVTTNTGTIQHAILPWKTQFRTIEDSLYGLIDIVRTDIQQGKVEIYRRMPVYEWLFNDDYPIMSDETRQIQVSDNVYEYIDSIYQIGHYPGYNFYYADGMLYRVRPDTSNTLWIYYPFEPIEWPFETKLSDIDETGYIIYDEDYLLMRNIIHSNTLFHYYYDSLSGEDAAIYSIEFTQGNYFDD
jgi:hypothetical protein